LIVVDTNILVYAADRDSPFHHACRGWLDARRPKPDAWYTTWPILYEFLRVTTHPRVMAKPWKIGHAWRFVDALLASPGLGILVPGERHASVAAGVVRELPHISGNLMHDAHTAILMREHGVRLVCTRDVDFHRFPFVQVVDPVAA
jgi:hypothetical protein